MHCHGVCVDKVIPIPQPHNHTTISQPFTLFLLFTISCTPTQPSSLFCPSSHSHTRERHPTVTNEPIVKLFIVNPPQQQPPPRDRDHSQTLVKHSQRGFGHWYLPVLCWLYASPNTRGPGDCMGSSTGSPLFSNSNIMWMWGTWGRTHWCRMWCRVWWGQGVVLWQVCVCVRGG